jgi:tRNA uridine 5-carboxymethylaminomethyl modification enzyme
MMTSRSEYRLLLRQDNADARLTPIGRELGLIDDTRWEMFHVKQSQIEAEQKRVATVSLPPSEALNRLLEERGTAPVTNGARLRELIRRPQLNYGALAAFDPERPELPADVTEQVEIQIKYEGYIAKQLEQVEQRRKLEKRILPEELCYAEISGLRLEAREKLQKIRPRSIAAAAGISGVTPADISVLLIELERRRRNEQPRP